VSSTSDWKLLESIAAEKDETLIYKFDYTADSSQVSLVSSMMGKGSGNYKITLFNENLKPVKKYPVISNEFDPKTFVLEDVVVTPQGQVILMGCQHEYQKGKRKNKNS